jgi:hypothetical protein
VLRRLGIVALLTRKGPPPTQRAEHEPGCPGIMPPPSSGERVAQTVEHVTFNHGVLGSIPSALTKQNQSLRSDGYPKISGLNHPEHTLSTHRTVGRHGAGSRRPLVLLFFVTLMLFGAVVALLGYS